MKKLIYGIPIQHCSTNLEEVTIKEAKARGRTVCMYCD